MSMLASLVTFSVVESVLEMVAWGSFGCLVFRLVRAKARYWYLECLLILALFLAWGSWTNGFIESLDVSFGNPDFLAIFDNDISGVFETDLFDIIIGAVQVFLGYMLAIFMLRKLGARQSKATARE